MSEKQPEKWERELLSTSTLTSEDIVRLHSIFDFFDTDRDGALSSKESRSALAVLGFDISAPTSHLKSPEFCRLVGEAKKKSVSKSGAESNLRLTFGLMDRHQEGKVSSQDLWRHVKSIGLRISEEEAARISSYICMDEETRFNEKSFVEFMKKKVSR